MKEYPICYSLDLNYLEQFSVSAASVLTNADDDENIKFFVLSSDLNEDAEKKIELLKKIKNFNIEYIKINSCEFETMPMLKERGGIYSDYHVSKPTYYRFMLPSLLKDMPEILYLDCDVIIKGSLKSLFETDIKNAAAAAVIDAESQKEASRLGISKYFNTGVMLINLDYWRTNDISAKLFDYAQKNRAEILWQDQDILNAVLDNEIAELPYTWNYQYFQYENPSFIKAANCIILHLAGRFKPWIIPFESDIYDEYYEYLKLTPFKNKILQYRLNSAGRRLKNNTGGSVTRIAEIPARDEIKVCFNYINERAEISAAETDVKISEVYKEITKNYKYTNELNENLKNEIKNEIENNGSRILEKAEDDLSKYRKYTDERIKETKKDFEEHLKETFLSVQDEILLSGETLKSNIIRDTASKINTEMTSLYKEINSTASELGSSVNFKIKELNEKNYMLEQKIEEASELLNSAKKEIIGGTEAQILRYNNNINKLKSEYEEKLEAQRNIYEQMLRLTENKIKELSSELQELKNNPILRIFRK